MTADTIRPISQWSGTFLSYRPILVSLVFAVIGTYAISLASSNTEISYNSIFSGVFDLLSIFTGFLATFYVFVVTKSNQFLRAIQHTKTFRMMLHLLRFTILWSVGMIAFSYVLMVLDLKGLETFSLKQGLIFFWVFNVILIGSNFSRCVRQFSQVTNIEVNDDGN